MLDGERVLFTIKTFHNLCVHKICALHPSKAQVILWKGKETEKCKAEDREEHGHIIPTPVYRYKYTPGKKNPYDKIGS